MPHVTVSEERCKGCELCVEACPQHVLGLSAETNSQGFAYATPARPELCLGCRWCAIACPDVAISIDHAGTIYRYFQY